LSFITADCTSFTVRGRWEYLRVKEELPMSFTQVAVTLIVIILAAVAVAAVVYLMRRRELRQRFGPEYDRVVSEQDGVLAAERELRGRERRHAELELRPLAPDARADYSAAWQEIQARFVETPEEAVGEANELVTRLIADRGYPTENYEDQLAHLSVEHARTLGQYRDANEIYQRHERGEASTEQLRQALVHYRALFADLLGEQPNGVDRSRRARDNQEVDR
jgi:hemerythrin-like domain-containing protein